MDPLRPLRAFDRFQQRHPVLAVPVAVLKKFADDGGGGLSGVIAYRAFFSLFPLLLLLTAVLGYVLAGDPELRDEAVDSVLAQFPVIGDEVRRASLRGSGAAIAIGVVGSLWAGFGVVVASERALDTVWAVPHRDRRDFFTSRLRALLLLAVLGTMTVASTVASGLVGGGVPLLGTTGSIAFSLAVNLVVFGTVFTLLGSRRASLRRLLPGVVAAAVCWTLLQLLGGYLVATQVSNAAPTYGTFAVVIGLLVWLHVSAVVFVLSAELNVVRARSLWPRRPVRGLPAGGPAGVRRARPGRGEGRARAHRRRLHPRPTVGTLTSLVASVPPRVAGGGWPLETKGPARRPPGTGPGTWPWPRSSPSPGPSSPCSYSSTPRTSRRLRTSARSPT